MIGYKIDKDSAIRICNSVYSILFGFTINSIFLLGANWDDYFIKVNSLSVLFVLYYILDWFLYKVIATIDKEHESIEVFLTILFIVFLGWLMVYSNNLNGSNVVGFCLAFCIYNAVSAALIFLRIYYFFTPNEGVEIDLKEIKIFTIESLTRFTLAIGGLLIIASYKEQLGTQIYYTKMTLIISVILLLIVKLARFLALVKITSKNRQEQ